MEEKWKDVPEYEGLYEVSNYGQVRSTRRFGARGGVLRGRPKSSGHLRVALCKDGVPRDFQVHRLVLTAFVGYPEEGQVACHGNGVPTDNRLSNLRWGSMVDNAQDAVGHGTHSAPFRGITHCVRGHQFNEENTHHRNDGSRGCKKCYLIRGREYSKKGIEDGDSRHGKVSGWGRGCRCSDCVFAAREYDCKMRKLRKERLQNGNSC